MNREKNYLMWRVHTPNMLKEIISNDQTSIFKVPINIFGKLLAAVGDRAAELNDPILNELMIRLTVYSVADPESSDYDENIVQEYLNKDIDNSMEGEKDDKRKFY